MNVLNRALVVVRRAPRHNRVLVRGLAWTWITLNASEPGRLWAPPTTKRYSVHVTHVFRARLLFGLALVVACGGSSATAPRYQPQVSNVTNNFAFQVTTLQSVSDDLEYKWQNDGTTANVNQSPSTLSGTVSLVILDAGGTQVYSRSLLENGTFNTSAGTSGQWTIRVHFSNASGAVNFRIQKP